MASSKDGWVLVVKGEDGAIRPYAPYDHEMTLRLPVGVPVHVQFKRPRSLPRHRLYRVLLRVVAKNTPLFATDEALHKVLLVGCGVTEPFVDIEGNISLIPSSTAFEKMGEDEFKAYFDKACEVITTHILPGVDLRLLLKEAKREARWNDNDNTLQEAA